MTDADFYDGNWDDEAIRQERVRQQRPRNYPHGLQLALHRLRSRRHGGGFRYRRSRALGASQVRIGLAQQTRYLPTANR